MEVEAFGKYNESGLAEAILAIHSGCVDCRHQFGWVCYDSERRKRVLIDTATFEPIIVEGNTKNCSIKRARKRVEEGAAKIRLELDKIPSKARRRRKLIKTGP